jgi:chromatin structure-remodeling complex subunit RSC9
MAPNKPNEPSAEYIQERDEFLDSLEEYHEKRG